MKTLILCIAAIGMVGCGKKQEPAKPLVEFGCAGTKIITPEGLKCVSGPDRVIYRTADAHRSDILDHAMHECLQIQRHNLTTKMRAICADVLNLAGVVTIKGTSAKVISCANRQWLQFDGENFVCVGGSKP